MPELVARLRQTRGEFTVDVELQCPPGITCVMGPSGSGKSTVLAAIAGLTVPERGHIAVGDEVWFHRERAVDSPGSAGARSAAGGQRGGSIDVAVHERRLAYVFQGLALFPHMTALRNVEYGMPERPRVEREARAMKLLARVGVEHLAHRKPRTFSGGEAQRVALARALAREPRLVLLDEPYSALDRDLRAQLIGLERDLAGELGVPIVHVTHSVAEARQLADQVVRMERGAVVARGAASEVLAGVQTLDE
jgi:molybdate transport system ATP-binding protein